MYYIDSASFSNATSVYLDELLTIIAPDGYYSYNSYYRQQVGGNLIDLLPCVGIDTVSITNVGATTATFNGNITNNSGDVNAVRGFVYGTSTNPTTANSVITDTVTGQGTYSLNATGLTPGVTYYVRAYTIVFGDTIYGDELSFMTVATCIEGWPTTNLNVSTYSDGTEIPQVTDPTAWDALTTGAWCYYNNNPANEAIYGKLYNWYAVAGIYNEASFNDPLLRKQLAPDGYHVPSLAEYDELVNCLGGYGVAGGKMKSTGTIQADTGLWESPNTGATNSSGFTGLPGGWRTEYGASIGIGYSGYWWASLKFNDFSGISMTSNSEVLGLLVNWNISSGLSVRIKQD